MTLGFRGTLPNSANAILLSYMFSHALVYILYKPVTFTRGNFEVKSPKLFNINSFLK